MSDEKNYITWETKDDIMLAHFTGALSSEHLNDIRKEMDQLIKTVVQKRCRMLAINLGGVFEFDSRGLGFLVKLKTQTVALDFELILYNLNTVVSDLLEVSTMSSIFTIMTDKAFKSRYFPA